MLEFDTCVFLPIALYLGEKNLPYEVPVFMVLRGKLEPTAYAQSVRVRPLSSRVLRAGGESIIYSGNYKLMGVAA